MKTINITQTTLFRVAAAEYGDATQAVRLAQANGLFDFIVKAPITIVVPEADPRDGLPR